MENGNVDVKQQLIEMINDYCEATQRDPVRVFNYIQNNFIVYDKNSFVTFEVNEHREAMIAYCYSKTPNAMFKLFRKLEGDLKEIGVVRIRASVDYDIAEPIARLFPDYHREQVIFSKELINDGEPVLD